MPRNESMLSCKLSLENISPRTDCVFYVGLVSHRSTCIFFVSDPNNFIPHIFVWGSCFWFCIPSRLRLRPAASASLNFVTHHLTPSFIRTQLCHTHTHHLSHTTLSHAIFHTQLCHTLSFAHNFVTHHLSHTTVICMHCLTNHATTASTTTAINKMDAAITLQTATQDHQTHWHSAANHLIDWLESAIYNGRREMSAKPSRPDPSHRRGSPHRRREPLFVRKPRVQWNFQGPNITLMQQFNCDLQALPCKSHYNCVDHRGNQQDRCSHYTASCNPRSPNPLAQHSQSSHWLTWKCTLQWQEWNERKPSQPHLSHRRGSPRRCR